MLKWRSYLTKEFDIIINKTIIDIRGDKMDQKYINFDLSLKYFIKDKNEYESCDCHKNTYDVFYGCNGEEVDCRQKDFVFVTGLMTYEDDSQKVCVTHSWVEYMGQVIDVTSLANSALKYSNNCDQDTLDEIEDILENRVSYIAYKTYTNNKLNRKFQEIKMRYGGVMMPGAVEPINEFLQDIVTSIELDKEFLNRVKNKFGFEFKTSGYQICLN